MHKYLYFLMFLSAFASGQNSDGSTIKRYYYKDKIVSVEIWIGNDKKQDSLKSYYSNGNLKEVFYFDEKGLKNSTCFQFNSEGEKQVSWLFSHGKLVSRTDHKLPFNKVEEEKAKKLLSELSDLNQRTNFNPTKINDLYNRGNLRSRLDNTTLALDDLHKVAYIFNKISKDTSKVVSETAKASLEKHKSILYDLIANIYLRLEMENCAIQYFYKAMASAPDDTRILYNFANCLKHKKSTELARYYLEKIVAEKPEHAHARWGLANVYSDLGEYQKALENINYAFKYEKVIIQRTTDYGGRDLKTTRGLIYHKLGESEKGIKDLKEELENDPKNSYAMKNLGIIYLDQKKYTEACQLFEKAKSLKYTLVFDEDDLDKLLESACNQVEPEIEIAQPKPFVYPNPATKLISIHNYNFKIFEFEVFDFESVSVLHGNTTDGIIDISKLKPGFYILKINNQNSPQTFKIIKH